MELQQLYSNGIELHEQGRFAEAVLLYQEVLHHIPDADLINYNLGLALYELKRYSEAMAAFSLATRQNQNDPDYWFNLGLAARQAEKYGIAQDAYRRAFVLQPDNSDILYNIGCCYRAAGEVEQAEEAFEKTLVLRKDHSPALNNLAWCLHLAGKYEHAVTIYHRLLDLRPDHDAASYMLAALEGDNLKSPPPGYVASLFDNYSADFDRDLLENLDYRVPGLLGEMIAEVIVPGHNKKTVVDLGCGTGLSGLAVVDFATNLIGVDLSGKMIEKAGEKGCYNSLVVGNAVDFLVGMEEPVDMLVAADMLTYLGELEPLFQAAGSCLAPGGWFCFSTESSREPGYQLRNTGRYAHHRDYIHELARCSGFKMLKRKKEKIRRERNLWITGDIYLFIMDLGT